MTPAAQIAAVASSRDRTLSRRGLASIGVVLGAIVFAIVVASPALVSRALVSALGPLPDPVFQIPLSDLVWQHLEIVFVSAGLTVLIGLPLGVWVTRDSGRDFRDIVSASVDFGQVFPPIAVLALVLPLLGIGLWPAVVALFLYGLFPVVSGTVTGIEGVPASVIDAARGMGMGRWRILFAVELPIASDVILAGVRTSVIYNVGTATVAAAVGAGGLGLPIFTGISTQNTGYILTGALAVSALALILDGTLAVLGMWLTPKGLQS
jgi:osmoprotectant transport system permease protein